LADDAEAIEDRFDATMTAQFSGLLLNPLPSPQDDPAATHESTVDYRLPFDGLWFIGWGGDTLLENYHVAAPDQRHALDILVWKDGGTHSGDGTVDEDSWAYGQQVLAPADGSVVVLEGLPDQTPGTWERIAWPSGRGVPCRRARSRIARISDRRSSRDRDRESSAYVPICERGVVTQAHFSHSRTRFGSSP
jgi:hypothetical protein